MMEKRILRRSLDLSADESAAEGDDEEMQKRTWLVTVLIGCEIAILFLAADLFLCRHRFVSLTAVSRFSSFTHVPGPFPSA
jgi:hypothetical protein